MKYSNQMKHLLILSSLVVVGCISFTGSVSPASSNVLKKKFSESMYTAPNGVKMMVRAFTPDISSPRKLPMIVYLHGAGQNGTDNESQLDDAVGCLYSFTHDRDDYKAVIVAPQCPIGVYWRNNEMLEALKCFIQKQAENPYIDESRIIVTGFSMGGDATWKIGLNYPTLATTLVPVCGGPLASMEPDIPNVPSAMVDLNIWAFNNFDDGVVRPNFSKRVFAQLWAIDSESDYLNFTENISGGHDAKCVYTNRDILIWMLSTRRR